jgi:hypothetical protein
LPALLDEMAHSSASVAAATKRTARITDPMGCRLAMQARSRQRCGQPYRGLEGGATIF